MTPFSVGTCVECYRTTSSDVVEWTGVVTRIRRHTTLVVHVDGLVQRAGPLAGEPVSVEFSPNGRKIGGSELFRIRPIL